MKTQHLYLLFDGIAWGGRTFFMDVWGEEIGKRLYAECVKDSDVDIVWLWRCRLDSHQRWQLVDYLNRMVSRGEDES